MEDGKQAKYGFRMQMALIGISKNSNSYFYLLNYLPPISSSAKSNERTKIMINLMKFILKMFHFWAKKKTKNKSKTQHMHILFMHKFSIIGVFVNKWG